MRIFIVGDTHFGHLQLIQYGRPADFTEQIFKKLEVVQAGDMLIHLGDFCIGQDEMWHKRYFDLLKGVKHIFVRGNHDSKSNSWYLDHGWPLVCTSFSFEMFGKNIMFSHYPTAWDGYYDVNVHGHFHDADHRRFEPQFTKILNSYHKLLALEKTNYQPVLLRTFLGL